MMAIISFAIMLEVMKYSVRAVVGLFLGGFIPELLLAGVLRSW
jgi:hypothetical protein